MSWDRPLTAGKPKPALSLRTTMLGLIALAIMAVGLPGLLIGVHQKQQHEHQRLISKSKLLADSVVPFLVNALVVGDLATAEQGLRGVNASGFFREIRLFEADGQRTMLDVSPREVSSNGVPGWFIKLLHMPDFRMDIPIVAGSVRYAVMRLQPDASVVEQMLWEDALNALSTTGLTLVLVLAMIAVILDRGFRPIRQLGFIAQRFGQGELQVRMPDIDLPEVSPTVKAFNSMADNLEHLLSEIQTKESAYRRLAGIVEQSEETIITLDRDHHITSWNRGAERMLGYPAAAIQGLPLTTLLAGNPGERADELADLLAIQPPSHWITQLTCQSGGQVTVAAASSRLLDEDGGASGHIVVARDITRIKAVEEALIEAKEAAETGNRMKSEFLANMSHEIRTPMNGVIGMIGLALETELDQEQREYLELASASAESLLTVINDILDFSKIEAGHLDMENIPFCLRSTLTDTLKSQALRAQDKGLELLLDIAPNIPDHFMGDPGRLRQVLLNLLGNAIKFTASGEVALHVSLETDTAEQCCLHFQVRDTGIGIPADKLASIFDAFSQADSSVTRKYGGTGLGLTITRRLVEMMHGQIRVESQPGVGSTFHFTACLEHADTPEDTSPNSVDLAGLRVLVVDDNQTNRRILTDSLGHIGMQVEAVDSAAAGQRALALAGARGQPKQFLLLDVQMPEMDGFTFAARLRRDPVYNELRIIMLSSVGMRGDAGLCRELGLAAYLTKPIAPAELLETLRMVSLAREHEPALVVTRHTLEEQHHALHILLAEDNPINQRLAVALLEKSGYRVDIAVNGGEAVEMTASGHYDLVLMDIQMPILNGLEATRVIREREQNGQHLPIIAMTANAYPEDRERCLNAGMDDYLSKPIQRDLLFEAINRIGN